jgi:hypothetical protein
MPSQKTNPFPRDGLAQETSALPSGEAIAKTNPFPRGDLA